MAVKLGNGNWAVKEDKLLAYNDNSGLFFNKEFDFSRGSTATYVGRDGLIASAASGVPRIDFTDNTNGHLLLEPSRTNLITYSEDYSQSEWTNASYTKDATITYNSNSIAPDGTLGVYQYESVSGTNSQLGALKAISSGVAYTNSVYLRRINGTGAVKIRDVNNTEKEITADLTSDWKRFEITGTSTSTVGRVYINVLNAGDIIEVWGVQLEAGSYPTSYIPTNGSTVTRLADVCNNSGSAQDFNSEEGVLYAEISALANDSTNRSISISDSTDANRIELRLATTDDRIQYNARTSSVTQASIFTDDYDVLDFNKIALLYKDNDFRLFVNGTQVALDTSGTAPTGLKELAFDLGDGSNDFYGNVKCVALFTEALTDEQLEKLTS